MLRYKEVYTIYLKHAGTNAWTALMVDGVFCITRNAESYQLIRDNLRKIRIGFFPRNEGYQ